jgi:glycosyltransferase involved in cell wall biosynthesis
MVPAVALTRRLDVALCDDFAEEGWPSMERYPAMLARELSGEGGAARVTRVRPPFVRTATRVPLVGRARVATNADRFLNRFVRYPRHASTLHGRYDVFHIVDHSYAHVALALPAGRTVVTCHDLDAFRPLLDPAADPRSAPFRWMTQRIAHGLARAAHVACVTAAVARQLVDSRLVDADRVSVVSPGVEGRFFADAPLLDTRTIDLLHVGSTVARKRIDVLLRVFAALVREAPALRLVRVGDPLTPAQRGLAAELGVADRIVERLAIADDALAACYREAALVLQPSDREGFGLPVLESLASGTPVVASDIATLREVGGDVVTYCRVGDVDAWARAIRERLQEREEASERWRARQEAGRARARQFTWARFTDRMVAVYGRVAGGTR